MKYCPCCKLTLDASHYYKSKDKLQCYCKSCWKQKQKDKYKKPDKRKTKAYILKHRFGLTLIDYHQMYENQKGCCAICGKPITLYAESRDLSSVACVDHNHDTLEVRGLLCNKCNTGIGMLNEDIRILTNAIEYIKKGVK